MVELAGSVYNNAGEARDLGSETVAVFATSVDAVATTSTGSAASLTETDSDGNWSFSGLAENRYDVRITDASSTRWLRWSDEISLKAIDIRNDTGNTTPAAVFTNLTNNAANQVAVFSGANSTKADDDEIYLSFKMHDSAGNLDEFARMTVVATDVTTTTEDGQIEFDVIKAGTLTKVWTITSSAAAAMSFDMNVDALTIGSGADTDISLTFDANSADGVITWMEDEDYFKFSDDILMNSTERLNFYDTAIYIYSSADGQLDLVADTEIQIAATTIDINGAVVLNGAITGATDITLSGELDAATLDISGNADIDGTLETDALTVGGTNVLTGSLITTLGTISAGVWQGTAIASGYIAADAITGAKIADDAIDSEHYTDGSIDTAHLAADVITGAKIADDAIDSEHYTDGSIDNAHIADDAIDSEHYADGSIDNAHIADDAIDSEHYAAASVDFAHIQNVAANSILGRDANSSGVLSEVALATTQILIGDGTGFTPAALSGDATMTNAGVVSLAAAQTNVTSLLVADIKIGEDDQTKIDFETADEIHLYAANVEQVYVADNIFGPQSDSDVDLGTTGVRWKDAFVDSITVTDDLTVTGNIDLGSAGGLLNVGASGNDWTATALNFIAPNSGANLTQYINNTSVDANSGSVLAIQVDHPDARDPVVSFGVAGGGNTMVIGVDNSESDRFAIADSGDQYLGTNDRLRLGATDGALSIDGALSENVSMDAYDDPVELERWANIGKLPDEKRLERNQRMVDMGVGEWAKQSEGPDHLMIIVQPMLKLLAGGIYQNRAVIDQLMERTEANDAIDERLTRIEAALGV